MLKTIREILTCVLLLALTAVAGRMYFLVGTTEKTMVAIPQLINDQAAQVHGDLSLQLSAAIGDVNDRLADSIAVVDRQISAARKDAVQEISATREVIQGPVLDKLDDRLASIQKDTNSNLVALNTTLADTAGHFNTLSDSYAGVPQTIEARLSPSFNALEPEITCRHADGTGYGGCWHSRITGLMGEAVNIGGVFTKNFPQLSLSMIGIAVDVHTFTSKAVAPRGKWATIKDILGTGSGMARAGAAVGLF